MVRIRAKPETYFRAYKLPEQPHDEELFQVAFRFQITRKTSIIERATPERNLLQMPSGLVGSVNLYQHLTNERFFFSRVTLKHWRHRLDD